MTYFSLIDQMPDGVLIINKEYEIVFWNKCLESWTGILSGDVLGSSVRNFSPLLSEKSAIIRVEGLFEGSPPVVFSSNLHKQVVSVKMPDGTEMLQHSTASSVEGEQGEPLAMFVIKDVTALHIQMDKYRQASIMAEMELEKRKAAEKRLVTMSLVVDQNPAAIFITDNKGIIEYVNSAFTELTGYSREECLGKTPAYFQSGVHIKEFYEDLWGTITSGNIWSGDICNKKKGGTLYWSWQVISPIKNRDGDITHYVSVKIDDTKRKEAEDALMESERELRKAQEIAKIGNWKWDLVTDEYVCFKEACRIYGMYGMGKSECRGTFEEFLDVMVHPEDRDRVRRAAENSKNNGEKFSLNFKIVDMGTGVEKTVHSEAEIYADSEGTPIKMLGMVQDITERLRMEAELSNSQRLESLGVLAGGIAHDFNNLLTIIMGNLSLALSRVKEGDKNQKTLNDGLMAVERAGELTNQLLSFSKGNKPYKEVSDVRPLLKESISLVSSGSGVVFHVDIDDSLPNSNIDSGQISQVVNNILINAKQAMDDKGDITLSTCKEKVGVDHPGLDAGQYIKISIKDTGCGMTPETMANIYDPYFTTKETGNGLGLASSFSIIKNHGGIIEVESEVGVGTTFHIYLPSDERDVELKEEKEESTESLEGKKILVMDDDEGIADLLKEMLEDCGYMVILSRRGEEAISFYKEDFNSDKPFDAVIMDLTIKGGLGGIDTIKELLQFDPTVKAIVSSGYSNESAVADFKRHGFVGAVSKPYSRKMLLSALREVFTQKSGAA